jgi:hypothetical protein
MYICWFYWGYEFVCWEKQTFLLFKISDPSLLKSYNEYRKLAIGSLFCSTFKPPGYTYLHSVDDIWFNKDPRVFRGMVGLLYEGQNTELSTTNTDLKKVLMWFQ